MSSLRTEISFCGLNLGRTLNVLAQRYVLFEVEKHGQSCRITVDSALSGQIVAYLEEKCYNVVDVRKIGASRLSEEIQRHFVLAIFVVVGIALLAFCSTFCLKIQVEGDYSRQEVLSALEYFGVKSGSSLSNVDVDVLENGLAVKLDAMYAVVHHKGSVLYVNVVKKKQIDSPVDVHSRRDVTATCSGTVVKVFCEQGTPCVSVGDVVQKGDVLICGLRTFNDGTSEDVYALGTVVLQQSCTAFAEFFGTVTETVDTGRTFCANSVQLFGKNYGKQPPFSAYRAESTKTQLFPLNLSVEKTIYYETQTVTRKVEIAEVLDALKKQALQKATEQANFVVQSVVFSVQSNGVVATVFGETQIN